MSRYDEIRRRMEEVQKELDAYEKNPAPTEDDNTRAGEWVTEWDALEVEYKPLAERAAKLDAIRNAPIRESGDGSAEAINRDFQVKARTADDVFDLSRSQFVGMTREQVDTDLRGRALKAVETIRGLDDDNKERVTSMVEGNLGDFSRRDPDTGFTIAEHILHTGSPLYRSAFNKWMRNPGANGWNLNDAERTAMGLTASNGGNMLPFLIDTSIVLSNAGTNNPFRQIARSVTGNQNIWHGVSSAGVTAQWLAESTEAADASPTVSQPSVTAYKGAAFLQASFEFLEDSNIETDLSMLLADAKALLEGTAFATGNGTSAPKGVVTALQAVTASRISGSSSTGGIESTATLNIADIYGLDNSLSPRWRDNARFVANKLVFNLVRRLGEGTTTNNTTFWSDFGGGLPSQLIGYPIHISSAMDSTIVSGSSDDVLILGDFRQFLIYDRIGMSLAYEPLMKGTGSGFPNGNVGWFATWRVGSDVMVADAFRMLRL